MTGFEKGPISRKMLNFSTFQTVTKQKLQKPLASGGCLVLQQMASLFTVYHLTFSVQSIVQMRHAHAANDIHDHEIN